jgi:hypothetical protein
MKQESTGARVTIALCVYNGESHLREQLDSILGQSEWRFELIALDDASRDSSAAVLRAYAARDSRIRFVANETNLGSNRSFERAMALGSAPYIAPSDQDDIWHREKLAKLLAAIGDCDLAYCDSAYIDAAGRSLGATISDDHDMSGGNDVLRFAFRNWVSSHAMLMRREMFERSRPFPESLYHDWWLAANAATGRGLAYVNEPLVGFRRHGAAQTSLGRSRADAGGRTRHWLAQSRHVLQLAATAGGEEERAAASQLRAALDRAAGGKGVSPLLGLIWRWRKKLSTPTRSTALSAIRLQWRLIRRLRRISRELSTDVETPG